MWLRDLIHEVMRRLHYSRRTDEAYAHWIKRFILWSGKRHPSAMGEAEVSDFLNHLATERNVAAATLNQALAALLFLYKQVLGKDLAWLDAWSGPSARCACRWCSHPWRLRHSWRFCVGLIC